MSLKQTLLACCIAVIPAISGCWVMGREYWGEGELSSQELSFLHMPRDERLIPLRQMPVEQQVDLLVMCFDHSHHGDYLLSREVAKRKEAIPYITKALMSSGHRARLGLLDVLHTMLHVEHYDWRDNQELVEVLRNISEEEPEESYISERINEMLSEPPLIENGTIQGPPFSKD